MQPIAQRVFLVSRIRGVVRREQLATAADAEEARDLVAAREGEEPSDHWEMEPVTPTDEERAMTTKTAKTTPRSTKEPTMKKTTEKKTAPKTTTKPAEKKTGKKAAPAVEPATEQPAVSDFTLAAGISAAAAIATSDTLDPDAEIEAVHEAAMKAAPQAIEHGADANACSDAVAAYAAGAIDKVEFHARLETAVSVASGSPVDAPPVEPAPATDDAHVANAGATVGACERCGRTDVTLRDDGRLTLHDKPDGSACNLAIEPIIEAIRDGLAEPPTAPEPDVRDQILARARTMTPAARRSFFESFDKKELLLLVERATGQKTSGRLSPKGAVERLLAVVEPEEPKADAKPAKAEKPAKPASAATSTRGRAAELPAVGTVLNNVDRHGKVRASCTVVEGGVAYQGKTYTSLSAAAIVASRDLGNSTKQTSGPRFWGLLEGTPRAPKAAKGLDLDVIGRAWDRYRERAEAATKVASDEEKAKLHALLNGHTSALTDLAAAVAA